MHYTVILICICIFIVWLIGLQVFKRILEDNESRPDAQKIELDVILKDYIGDSNPPLISAVSESGEEIYLNDYDKKFEFAAQVYYNKWAHITLVNHYYGFLIIRITKKVFTITPVYK